MVSVDIIGKHATVKNGPSKGRKGVITQYLFWSEDYLLETLQGTLYLVKEKHLEVFDNA